MSRALRLIATAAAVFAIAATQSTAAADGGLFRGEGTTYTLGEVGAGNCNMMAANSDAAANYAALNDVQWNGLKNCGRCARVWCDDDRCADRTTSIDVQILDRCPECKHGDLDLSPSVFKALTHSDPSRYKIKWKFVDCAVRGNVKYCLKGGSNSFWTAIQPANTVAGVSGMQVNGKPTTMVDSAYYYLLNGNSQTQTDLSSVKVTLTSVSGETITDTVSLVAGSCTSGSLQFGGGGSFLATLAQVVAAEATVAPPVASSPPVTSAPTTAPSPTPSPVPSTTPPSATLSTSAAVTLESTSTPPTGASSSAPTTALSTIPSTNGATEVPVSTVTSSPPVGMEAPNSSALDLTVAPTLSPSPTSIVPEPAPASTSPPTPSSQSNNSTSATRSSGNESDTQKNAVGVPVSLAPTSGEKQQTGGESTTAPAPASTIGTPVQAVQKITTRNTAANGATSPLILILSACGAVGIMVLIIMAAVVHRRKIRERKQADDEPVTLLSVLTRSYDRLSPASEKADIAVL